MPVKERPPTIDAPHAQETDAVAKVLGSHIVHGLSSVDAQNRLQTWGRNELASEPELPAWRKFLRHFQDMLVVLLLLAAAVSTILWLIEREAPLPYEALAILAVVLGNAVMGYVQESRAESAIAALRKMSTPKATVIRDGKRHKIPAAEVVVGDLLLLEEGDTVPADGRLVHATTLHMAEAILTGESVPVTKSTATVEPKALLGDRLNMVFSGTSVAYGHGIALVTAIGMQSEMGRIAGLLHAEKETATPLQIELQKVGRLLGSVVVAIALVMIATILLVEKVEGLSALFKVLILGVALAVAAVPEGLPAVVTAVLALGVQRMSHRKAIVRHLAAVESLGEATVIASDKTGTLTKNEMTVRKLVVASGELTFTGTGYTPEGTVTGFDPDHADGDLYQEVRWALYAAELASNAALQHQADKWTVHGDPTEIALLVAVQKIRPDRSDVRDRFVRVSEVPFSSERKLMTTLHLDAKHPEQLKSFTKGAPDVLILRCTEEWVGNEASPLTPERRRAILQANEQLADQALRTLALAMHILPRDAMQQSPIDRDFEHGLIFLGLVGMIDPPREEAKEAVATAKRAGIRPLMITGDHPRTAAVIAAELGISPGEEVITGSQIEALSDEGLAQAVDRCSVYARVNPEHKLRVVNALQASGEVVAMTGDGVNDAPALKTADIGIAMGITGTDVSKEAADLVLMDDNFATIVAAVEEGRGIFANIRKFLRYLMSSNMGEVMTMFFGVLLSRQLGLHDNEESAVVLPLLATHILWINLVTDGMPALALGVEPTESGLMELRPRPRSEGVLTPRMWTSIFLLGSVMAFGTLLVLDASLPGGWIPGSGSIPYAQTMAFTTLTLFQLFNVFNARSEGRSAFAGMFRNRWLWLALGISLGLQCLVVYLPWLERAFSTTPLSAGDWCLCAAVASSVIWLGEIYKWTLGRSSHFVLVKNSGNS